MWARAALAALILVIALFAGVESVVMTNDPLDPVEGELTIPFAKNFRYAYQHELRIAMFPPTPVEKLDDLKICLGKLSSARLTRLT